MRIYILSLGLGVALTSFAQFNFSGVVTDKKGDPLEGVNILVQGTTLGTTSDKMGAFYLTSIPERNNMLRLSFSGYTTIITGIEPNDAMPVRFIMEFSPIDLNAVVVTASRSEQIQSNTPVIVNTIEGRKITERGISYVPELLSSADASFETNTSNAVRSYQLGGLGPQFTLFLLNGERLSGETKGAVDLSRINPSSVQRIEVVKGASSTLYGSNAIGGVVNIITREIPANFELNAGTYYSLYTDPATQKGKNDTYHYLNLGLRKDRFSSVTNLKFNSYDSYDLSGGTGVSGFLTQEKENNYAINQRFTYAVNSQLKVNAYGSFYQLEQNYALDGYPDKRSQDYTYGAKATYAPVSDMKLELSFNGDNNRIYDVYTMADSLDYNNRVNTVRLLGNYTFSDKFNLIFGSEYFNEKLSSVQNSVSNKELNNAVVLAQAEYNPILNLSLTGGIRADVHNIFGLNLTPQFSALYKLDVFQFRAGYGMGYRTPDAKELYTKRFILPFAPNFFLDGNEDLNPEDSEYIRGSISYQRRTVSFSLAGSVNRISNLITNEDSIIVFQMMPSPRGPMPFVVYQYNNIDEADIKSLDANFSWSPLESFSFSASYVLTDGRNLTKNQPLNNTRKHQVRVNVDYFRQFREYKLGLNLFGGYYGKKAVKDIYSREQPQPQKTLSDYQLLNFTTTHTFHKRLVVTLGIKNIFDVTDQAPRYYNIQSPGRTYYTGISVNL